MTLDGKRVTTMELKYWRAIHSEIMTHRDRARNAASSRAIPFYRESNGEVVPNCTYAMLCNDPFMPQYIGREQRGMQSGAQLGALDMLEAHSIIKEMLEFNLNSCMKLFDMGVHKSIINRYLEPWSYITVVMTATEWKNFFRLRIHEAAEKHFQELARMMQTALEQSTPTFIDEGQWHLPYITEQDVYECASLTTEPKAQKGMLKRISAARCARVSYLNHDGKRSVQDDLRLFSTLIETDPNVIHASPLEHVLTPREGRCGPFNGWATFRSEFANENVPG